MTIKELCALFDIGGRYVGCKEISTGNVNSTYGVEFVRDGEQKKYILQKINKNVFKNPPLVMDNIVRVTEHIREKVKEHGDSTKTGVLRVFLSREDKKPYIVDDCGEYWRCYRFIKNSITYDTCDDLDIIRNAGSAFGRFQNYLRDFNAETLFETIPNFHNTIKRYEDFHEIVEKDEYKRAKKVSEEIGFLLQFEQQACLLQKYLDCGEIPYRVTHNDTKCNNVSFDKNTGVPLAVLDLDTVMSGAIAHDFGDAIRFIANAVIEDEPDVSKVCVDLDKYEAFTKGFIDEVKDTLTPLEKQTMNLGVFAMTVELAVRFLGDYLNGDKYFKTRHPGHNLERARNQIALAQDILKKKDQLDQILQKYI